MNQQSYGSDDSKRKFKSKWGAYIDGRGFTQSPNDLIRYPASLGLSVYDLSVMHYIMSVQGGYASAKDISTNLGISIKRVRKSFHILREKGLVTSRQKNFGANCFEYSGLVRAVEKDARERHRATLERDKGLGVSDSPHTPYVHSNEDSYKNEDDKEGRGYKKFKQILQKLKGKRPDGL
jgi:predicted transcriptional regulator